MAFLNTTFPALKLKHGITKEIYNPVSITGNGTREVRRKQNKVERFVWNIPSRALFDADKLAIVKFLNTVDQGLKSFLFQDPDYPEFNNAKLGFRSGTTWYFNLPLDSSTAGNHPVLNASGFFGGLSFTKNGTPIGGVTYGVDGTTGLPYVTVPTSINTDTIRVTGPVYLTARFEGNLSYSITAMEKSPLGGTCNVIPSVVTLNDFKLVEVFE